MKILLIGLFMATSALASECEILAQTSLDQQARVNTLLENPIPYNVISPVLFKQTEDIKNTMITCKEERSVKMHYCEAVLELLEKRDDSLLKLKQLGLINEVDFERVESRQDFIRTFVSFRCR